MNTKHSPIPAKLSRRGMLKLTGVGLAAPFVLPASSIARRSPSNTIRIGCVGMGVMGGFDMVLLARAGLDPAIDARVVAVCDVNANRAADGRDGMENYYAEHDPDGPRPRIAVYGDYRDMLARGDIDVLCFSTPDHWHAFNGIDAANAGKDIYLQKPLTWSIEEGQALVEAVRRNNVILQTGSQQRSEARFRKVCQTVRNEKIGKLHSIHVTLPVDSGHGNPDPMPVPPHLDYDLWLGPAPYEPYTEDRVHPDDRPGRAGWLQIERYCRGMITGWGTHMFDIAQWGNGTDNTGPVEMTATAKFPDRGLWDVHTEFEAEGMYANGVKLTAASGPHGTRFEGDDGWIFVDRFKAEASDPALLEEGIEDGPVRLYESDDHYRNFLECVRTRKDPVCPVEIGHRSNTVCIVTHIAMKLGRKVRWDPQAERFIDDDEANAMLSAPYREGWTRYFRP